MPLWAYPLLRACELAQAEVRGLHWPCLSAELSMEKPWAQRPNQFLVSPSTSDGDGDVAGHRQGPLPDLGRVTLLLPPVSIAFKYQCFTFALRFAGMAAFLTLLCLW